MENNSIPEKTHRAYRELVLGEKQVDLKCLALKILLGRIQLSTLADKSPNNVEKHVDALHSFFCMNEVMARRDIAAIFACWNCNEQ
jgi:hypothetical protein